MKRRILNFLLALCLIAGLLYTSNKASIYIIGCTVNLEKTAGASYPVFYGSYARTQIKNCTLNVTQLGATGDSYPTMIAGFTSYALTI